MKQASIASCVKCQYHHCGKQQQVIEIILNDTPVTAALCVRNEFYAKLGGNF